MISTRPAVAAAAILFALLCPSPGQARSWQGVEPGRTRLEAVVSRFGEPTTKVARGQRSVAAYKGDQALPGTREVQFLCRADGVVEEIVVFLAAVLDAESVEGTFGRPQARTFVEATFKKVWLYPQKGVTVFFDKEGAAVEIISYGIPSAGKGAAAPVPDKTAPAEAAR